MSLESIMAGAILVSLTFYVLLAGADFGAGVWHLLAHGRTASAQRALIDRAIGPIWEANHVWLILSVTVLFTAFPRAFAEIGTSLHIPLTLLLIGIVLRGSAFAFRTHDVERAAQRDDRSQAFWQKMFAVSSMLTPIVLGIVIGAIASGTIDGSRGDFYDRFIAPWFAPFPLAIGILTLVLFAFLAAVYLVVETRSEELREDFRRRAIITSMIGAGWGLIALGLSNRGAPMIWHALTGTAWGWLVVLSSAVLAAATLFALWTRQYRMGRVMAAGQAILMLWGWGLAQFPYLLPPAVTVHNAAASAMTLRWMLVALVLGALLLFPSLYYLMRVFRRVRPFEP